MTPAPLSFDQLETVYDGLANALDAVGPAQEALFLTRLALILARDSGNQAATMEAIKRAMDIESSPITMHDVK